jgi:hypothetical protein
MGCDMASAVRLDAGSLILRIAETRGVSLPSRSCEPVCEAGHWFIAVRLANIDGQIAGPPAHRLYMKKFLP